MSNNQVEKLHSNFQETRITWGSWHVNIVNVIKYLNSCEMIIPECLVYLVIGIFWLLIVDVKVNHTRLKISGRHWRGKIQCFQVWMIHKREWTYGYIGQRKLKTWRVHKSWNWVPQSELLTVKSANVITCDEESIVEIKRKMNGRE